MIKFRGNKVIIELSKKEINHLLEIGILYNPRKDEYKFLDKQENIFIELKGGNKMKTKEEIEEEFCQIIDAIEKKNYVEAREKGRIFITSILEKD